MTGVQTCALPIYTLGRYPHTLHSPALLPAPTRLLPLLPPPLHSPLVTKTLHKHQPWPVSPWRCLRHATSLSTVFPQEGDTNTGNTTSRWEGNAERPSNWCCTSYPSIWRAHSCHRFWSRSMYHTIPTVLQSRHSHMYLRIPQMPWSLTWTQWRLPPSSCLKFLQKGKATPLPEPSWMSEDPDSKISMVHYSISLHNLPALTLYSVAHF